MNEKTIMLKSYRKEIEVLSMEIDVPVREEKDKYFYSYEDLLLKLFNNKRDNKEILKIENYYGNNVIRVLINLTSYMDNYSSKESCIKFLKDWFRSNIDIAEEEVKTEIIKGFIYTIPEWENNIKSFEGENEDLRIIHNYIEWED